MSKDENKTVIVWAVMPHDMEYSVQYCDTKEQADAWALTYKSGATVEQVEQLERVIERKGRYTARRGYGL